MAPKDGIVPYGSLVLLDAHILIWSGVRRMIPGVPPVERRDVENVDRARILINDLTDVHARIVVPSVLLTELIVPIPPEHHSRFLAY
ncbi:hypothetical protein, partial [Aquisphaera insulae]|uniref:hypothetical protein n=1 Tax=Aquisphaera insulae TaxID=2712864 RepID=UPI00196AA6D9